MVRKHTTKILRTVLLRPAALRAPSQVLAVIVVIQAVTILKLPPLAVMIVIQAAALVLKLPVAVVIQAALILKLVLAAQQVPHPLPTLAAQQVPHPLPTRPLLTHICKYQQDKRKENADCLLILVVMSLLAVQAQTAIIPLQNKNARLLVLQFLLVL